MPTPFDPIESLAGARHEFGEHGGVNMSIEASTTFTVMTARMLPEIFRGRLGPEAGGCYLYGRHFNPTVYALGRQMAAIEGTEFAYCASSGMSATAAIIMQRCHTGDHVVVHSLTKFVGGASDTIGGAICGSRAFIGDLMDLHTGALMQRLHDPDLGFGGMMAVDLGGEQTANRFMELLQNRERFGYMAVSLGYFDTLMSCSAGSTSSELNEEEQRAAGISPGLVRLSIGYTGSLEQRWRQMLDVLHELGLAPPSV